MVTEKEKALILEILDEGQRKYDAAKSVVADILGCSFGSVESTCGDVWRQIRRADLFSPLDKAIKDNGISLKTGDPDGLSVALPDGTVNLRVRWYASGDEKCVAFYQEPDRYKCRADLDQKFTATDAIDAVSAAIREMNAWAVVAGAYRKAREEADRAECVLSDKRVEKARHQLELLKKL